MEQESQKSNVVEAIREEALSNDAFATICYDFSQRERTRSTVTVRGLKARMEKQGADFSIEVYRHALLFLGKLGLGKVEMDKNNNVKALSNMKVTLQSIGQASGQKTQTLKRFTPASRFEELRVKTAPTILRRKPFTAKLSLVHHEGGTEEIASTVSLKTFELVSFLNEFREIVKKYNG